MAGLQLLGEPSQKNASLVLSLALGRVITRSLSTVCSPDRFLGPCHIVIHLPGHLPHHSTISFGAGTISCSSL